ncbi:MAG TPA: serine/threonine-protein kinase [Planctomicrobium sp.]|nr:serine/threonine-protein kinase [Planctomicrobium sp.]
MSDASVNLETTQIPLSPEEEERQLRLEELAAEFLERRRQGERISIQDAQQQHPEFAAEIEELFPAILKLEGMKQLSHSSSSRRAVVGLPALGQLGDFKILREIGRGGMGVVFEAEQVTLHRRVALKVLGVNVATTATDFARFRREAESAAKLHHTNIVPVYGTGEDYGVHFYAMQYIPGWSLAEVIETLRQVPEILNDGGLPASRHEQSPPHSSIPESVVNSGTRLEGEHSGEDSKNRPEPGQEPAVRALSNPRVVAKTVADLADAVAYAHGQGVIHRDIKPSNILIDRQGVAWLVDFGLATGIQENRLTRSGHVTGTVQYMAPEQIVGQSTEQSDIYSLGLTLYELLALRPAYADTNHARLIQLKSSAPPPPLRSVAPHVSRDLETIVMKACSVVSSHRYQSAAEMAEDLRRFVNDEPILARRITPLEQMWRWGKRHKVVASLSAVAMALLLALIVSLAIGKHRSELALKEISAQKKRTQENLAIAVQALNEITENVSARGIPRTLRIETEAGEARMNDVAVSDADARLLATLLKFYEKFAENNGANLDVEAARTEMQIGEIEVRLGHLDKASDSFSKAIARYSESYREHPRDETLLLAQVSALNSFGITRARSGDVKGAVQAHWRAKGLLESCPNPSSDVRFALAKTLTQLSTVGPTAGAREIFAVLEPANGRPPWPPPSAPPLPAEEDWGDRPPPLHLMLEYLDQSSRLLRDLVQESPKNPEYRLALAKCELDRREFVRFIQAVSKPDFILGQVQGILHSRVWELLPLGILKLPLGLSTNPPAPDLAIEPEAILRELAAEFPESPSFQFELAEALITRSRIPGELDAETKNEHLREAVRIAETLVSAAPRNPAYRALLAQAKHQFALVAKLQGETDEAAQQLNEALEILKQLTEESVSSSIYHVARAQLLLELAAWQRQQGNLEAARQSVNAALDVAERTAPAWGNNHVFQEFLKEIRRKAQEGQ